MHDLDCPIVLQKSHRQVFSQLFLLMCVDSHLLRARAGTWGRGRSLWCWANHPASRHIYRMFYYTQDLHNRAMHSQRSHGWSSPNLYTILSLYKFNFVVLRLKYCNQLDHSWQALSWLAHPWLLLTGFSAYILGTNPERSCPTLKQSFKVHPSDFTSVLLAKYNDTLQSYGNGQILQSNTSLLSINYRSIWPASL